MQNCPLISIIVPVYNSSRFLSRCIDSIVSQTYRQLEILLIDDGSSDDSGDICDKYAKRDERIKVFHNQNAGTGPTRQFGYEHSTGELVAFVDNDDYITPNMYEVMLKALLENNADVCACQFNYVHIDGTLSWTQENVNPAIYGVHNSIEFSHFLYDGGISNGVVCSIWNKLFKSDVLRGVKMRNGRGEEEEVNDYVNKKGCKVIVIEDQFYFWCENVASVTHKAFNPKNYCFLEVLEQRAKWFDMDEFVKNETLRLYCNLFVEYFYKAKKEGVIIPSERTAFFQSAYRLLFRSKYCDSKFYARMLLFSAVPSLYGKLVKL